MRTNMFETRLYLNSNFENYDIELKKYFKTNTATISMIYRYIIHNCFSSACYFMEGNSGKRPL